MKFNTKILKLILDYSTNHKDNGTLDLSFALIAGLLGLKLSSCSELATPVNDFCFSMMSFNSVIQKVKPKILYLGGSILANQVYHKYYSFRPTGIGKSYWNPDNYSVETQKVIDLFKTTLINKDKTAAYDIIYAVLINNMLIGYNQENDTNMITEKEFLDVYGYEYVESDLSFLDKTNRGTIMSNICEILAPKIVMQNKNNILIERSIKIEGKVNLSFQKNPEYTIAIFTAKSSLGFEQSIIIYDSDFKITDDFSLNQKFTDLSQMQFIKYNKQEFGMNIVVVASLDKQDSEIIFSPDQIRSLIAEIKKLSKNYPDQFSNFDENSEIIAKFKETGKVSLLNKSDLPIVRYYRPIEFYKLPHNNLKLEKSKVYLDIISKNNERSCVKEESTIIENLDDNN